MPRRVDGRLKIRTYIDRNKARVCDYCKERPRHCCRVLCQPCRDRERRHGHPGQLRITGQELAPYRLQAAKFIRKNKAHPGIVEAIQWLEAWATVSEQTVRRTKYNDQRSTEIELAKNVARLAGSPGKEVLSWLMACAFLREQRPHRFKSDKAWDHAVALTLFRRVVPAITPRNSYPKRAALEAAANHINQTLGPLLQNAAKRWLEG